ncbi:MAG: phosphoribosyltransferase family protein [Patescibacteria group bacterium]|nr:phosphoribosyltransferase family protein [Patescibacteria group bacterium]
MVYTSGKHGDAYVNKDAIYPYTADIFFLCYDLAGEFTNLTDNGPRPEVVIAPAIGGVILSQWTAHHLGALALYAEKDGDLFVIKRGYDKLIKGKKVLVVEDVITTGGSVKKVVEAARACGGEVIGVGALCNRGKITAGDLDVPQLVSLLEIPLKAYEEADCPLCKAGVPINIDVGKGREYLQRKQG